MPYFMHLTPNIKPGQWTLYTPLPQFNMNKLTFFTMKHRFFVVSHLGTKEVNVGFSRISTLIHSLKVSNKIHFRLLVSC